ncbi:DUF368 domain-containing protein [Anaerovorax odorimutans]|uniref:DUF368 domain-containing protein n=1 Tax=Anaerovorax odorimutans TaxID=109327 RepID=A0ABT1RJN3_9FIRM|nr:DUF368 domain-containing protein [Anaerovorax odorimutans]MCQ4635390.1 DUF368 domain-containing protein [Anaerovorax odorimutans]
MSFITRVLYGVLIGVASIAPGLSGGTIAIALGFYEHLINAIADLLKHFRKNFLYLLPYGIGGLASVACLSVAINYLFIHYPLPTNTLFIGFIIGTLPFIWAKLKSHQGEKGLRFSHVLTAGFFFLIVLIPVFAKGAGSGSASLSAGPLSMMILVGIGMIAATTLVVPGLSGTMILTSLGYYKPLLSIASTFVTAAFSLDFPAAARQLIFIVPLGVGVVIGVFLTAKFVQFLFKKIPSHVYSAIAGLIAATPVVMLADVERSAFSPLNIGLSAVTLLVGLFLTRKLGE